LSLPDLIQQGQLPPHSEEKNVVSQINRYNRWLLESGRRLVTALQILQGKNKD